MLKSSQKYPKAFGRKLAVAHKKLKRKKLQLPFGFVDCERVDETLHVVDAWQEAELEPVEMFLAANRDRSRAAHYALLFEENLEAGHG